MRLIIRFEIARRHFALSKLLFENRRLSTRGEKSEWRASKKEIKQLLVHTHNTAHTAHHCVVDVFFFFV